MSAREKAGQVLGMLAEKLKMEETLALDANGCCSFVVDERYPVIVKFQEESEHLLLNLPLGVLPEGEAGKATAMELLAGNYCWQLTAGGNLGLDRDTGILGLFYGFDVSEGKGDGLDKVLGDLLCVAEFWIGKLNPEGKPVAPPIGQDAMRV